MVSRNNTIKRWQENSEQRPHFAIRKLSIGAASVLIGLSFLGMGHQTVKADTNNGNDSENSNASSGDVDKSTQAVSTVPNKVVVETNSLSSDSPTQAESSAAQTSLTDNNSEETESSKSKAVNNADQDLKIDSAKLGDTKISKDSLVESKVSVPSASGSASAASAKASNSSISEDESAKANPDDYTKVTRKIITNLPKGYTYDNGSNSTESDQSISKNGDLPEYKIQSIEGYTPTATQDGKEYQLEKKSGNYYVPSIKVPLNSKGKPTTIELPSVIVSYQANQISNEIDFVDNVDSDNKEKQIVGTQTVQGKTDETINLSLDGSNKTTKLAIPEGYEIVPSTKYPTAITLKPQRNPVEVYVQKNDRKLIINYISDQQDNSNGKTIGNQTVKGKSGQTVKFTLEVPIGWEVVPNQEVPSGTITFGNVDSSPQTVYIQHKIDTTYAVNHENDNDLYRTVTRIIEATQSGEKQSQIGSETRNFYRNKSYDEVTKKKTYTDWQSANSNDNSTDYSSFSLPYLEGYTVSAQENGKPITVTISNNQALLAAESAIPNQTTGPIDRKITVTYTKTNSDNPDNTNHDRGQDTVQTINLIDSDESNKTVATQTVNGKVGQTKNIALHGETGSNYVNLDIPANYELKPGSTIDTIINFVKNAQPINIYLSHKKQQINLDEQTDNPDYYRQITRTIIYNIPDEPQQTGKQYVTYYRNGTKDLVTGKTTYTDWKEAQDKQGTPVNSFPSISLQNLKNYDLSVTREDGSKVNLVNGAIPEVKVTPETKSSRLTVTYTKKVSNVDPNQKYNYLINYIDQANSQNVGQQNISGKAGEKVTITLQMPDGYELTKGEEVPSSVTFGNQDLAPTNVYVIKKGSTSPVDKVIQSIVYQDKKDGKTIETQNISGTSGDYRTIQWDSQNPGQIVANIPQGWVLSGKQELPSGFTFAENASPIIAIIEHKLDPVAASDHQGDPNFNRTVTRTIVYNYPNAKSQELTQEVSFARNAQYDEVTKNYLYGDWVANSVDAETGAKISDWPAENFKTIDGYDPQVLDENGNEVKDAVQNGQIIIPAKKVAAETKNQTWTVNYLAQSGHHYTVNFISQQADDRPNQIIQSQILTGKTGETVQFNLQLPTGWEVVPNTKIPQNGSITFGAKDFDPVSVYVQHKIDMTYGFQNQNDSHFFQTVTRTINISLPAGYTISNNPVMQTREYYRNKLHDEVTGKDSYSPWKSYNTDNSNYFGEYDGLPYDNTLKDYTVTATDNGQNVTVTEKDGKFVLASQSALDNNGTPINRNVSVVYTKKGENPKTYTINYIDEKDKSNVGSQSISGQTGQKVDFTLDLPDGYELAKGQTLPTSYTFGNKDASIDIAVQKKTSDNNHPNEGNVTVTINYVDHDNTNDVISSQKVSGKSGSYELIDWSGSGATNTIKPEIPANWQLATGVKQPDSVNFKDGNVVKVFIEHATQEEKGLDHKGDSNYYREITRTINQILPGQPTNVMKQMVIYYRDGTLDKVTDQVTYGNWQAQGSSQWDKMNLPVSKGYDVSYIDDQGNKLNGIEAVKVNQNTPDTVINVNYLPAQESITINYVDSSDKTKVLGSQTITGRIGDTVHTVLNVPANWQIVAKQPDYSTYAFGTNTPKSATVLIEHQVQTTYAENNQDNSNLYRTVKQTIIYNYPGETAKPVERVLVFFRDAHKDLVTGQTSYDQWQPAKDKNGQVMDNFEEINVPDIKGYTAEVKDQDGKTITLVGGPEADVKYIPEVKNVKYNSKDLAYAVNYIKDGSQIPDHSETASLVINYVNNDDHSQIVGSQTVSGKVGLAVPVTLNAPEKWMVAEPDKAPTAVMISKDASPVTIYVVHKQITLKGINDPTNKALNRDATRTIVLHLPDNATQEITQKVTYVRNQITDEYTGNVTYSNWELADPDEKNFGQVDVTVAGYTAQVDGKPLTQTDGRQYIAANDSELKNGEPVDQMVTVNYVGNKQSITITYVDQNSVTIGSPQTVSGRTGQTISLPLQVPAGYEVVGTIPSTYTFGAKDNKNLTVTVTKLTANQGRQTINYYDENNNLVGSQYVVGKVGDQVNVMAQIPLNYELATGQQVPTSVEIQNSDKAISIKVNARLVKVDHQQGIEAGAQIPGENGTYPAGLSKDDLNKAITRTINITDPLTGKIETKTQTVTVSRDATYNLVTGEISYHNLQAELPEYNLPSFEGYKANTSVDAMKVDFDTPNQVVDVTYTKISSNGGGNSGDNNDNGGSNDNNNGNGGNNNGGSTNNDGGQINNGSGTNTGNGSNTNNGGTTNNSGAANGRTKQNNSASAPSANTSKANGSNNDNAAPVYRHKSHHVSSKSKHGSRSHRINTSHGYSRSPRTSSKGVAAHSQDAHWLARHGYVVNVGPHGEVESYQKASDGQGRIVNVTPHAYHGFANAGIRAGHPTANAGIRAANLSNSGLNGSLSNSANTDNTGSNIVLPGTGAKNDQAAVATAGLATVSLGLIGLAGVRKKRKNSKKARI